MSLPSEPFISSPDPLTKPPKSKRAMSRNQKILFFVTGWLIVLMPFLFWWNTWFGRHLSDQQMTEYLHDDKKPRHIQHALVQLGDRMSNADVNAKRWYPDLILLATNPVEEVRNTDAWVMGQDTSAPGFHETLLKMLADPAPMVRGNAALSLVRFGDASGTSADRGAAPACAHHRTRGRPDHGLRPPGHVNSRGRFDRKARAIRLVTDRGSSLANSRPHPFGSTNWSKPGPGLRSRSDRSGEPSKSGRRFALCI